MGNQQDDALDVVHIPSSDCEWEDCIKKVLMYRTEHYKGHHVILDRYCVLTIPVSYVHVNRGGWIKFKTDEPSSRTLTLEIPPLRELKSEQIMMAQWEVRGE